MKNRKPLLTSEYICSMGECAEIINIERGYDNKNHSFQHLFAMAISELYELIESDRKDVGSRADKEQYGHVFNISFVEQYDRYVKGTVEEELSDALIRLASTAYICGFCPEPTPPSKHELWSIKHSTMPENVYAAICQSMSFRINSQQLEHMVNCVLWIAQALEIDLQYWVEQKLIYLKANKDLIKKGY